MKVLEEEAGKACNRETIAKAKLTKLMTITSEDFEQNTEIIGTSELMDSEDFFTLGKVKLCSKKTYLVKSDYYFRYQ